MTTDDSAAADDALLLPEWLPAVGGSAAGAPRTDANVLASLHEEFYRRLVQTCRRYVRDEHLAEDVAQEAILQAARSFETFDATRPVWPWLRRIALRIASRERNNSAIEWTSEMAADDPQLAKRLVPPADPDQWSVLRLALAAVPARQRAALVVRYLNDWSTADAARLFQMDENAFDQLLWRARRRLAVEYRRLASADDD